MFEGADLDVSFCSNSTKWLLSLSSCSIFQLTLETYLSDIHLSKKVTRLKYSSALELVFGMPEFRHTLDSEVTRHFLPPGRGVLCKVFNAGITVLISS